MWLGYCRDYTVCVCSRLNRRNWRHHVRYLATNIANCPYRCTHSVRRVVKHGMYQRFAARLHENVSQLLKQSQLFPSADSAKLEPEVLVHRREDRVYIRDQVADRKSVV